MQSCGRRLFRALTSLSSVPLTKYVQCQTGKKCDCCLNSLSASFCDGSLTHKEDWDIRLPFLIHGARVCICILQIVLVSLTLHVWIANRMHVYLRDGSPFPQWSSMRWVFHETVQNCVSWSNCNHMPLVSHPSHGHTFHSSLNPNSYFCICVAVAFVVTFLLRVSDRKTAGIWEDCSIWFWWLPCQDRRSQVCPTYQDCLCYMEFASLFE
jgi:hypothetical protein